MNAGEPLLEFFCELNGSTVRLQQIGNSPEGW
jgi:hypothetical protein